MTPLPNDSHSTHRQRLLQGMAQAVAAKGYADTTITDIVREAAVSRRTFYEHFDSKADCLIALYGAASHNALKVLREAINPARDWQVQVESALHAYFGCLAQNPVLLRTLFVEILGLGPDGLAARRRMNEDLTSFMLEVVNAGEHKHPLSHDMAVAVVGGVNELALQLIEQDRMMALQELVAPTLQLLRAVTAECD